MTAPRIAGEVEGIAIYCGVPDSYGEIVLPGMVAIDRGALERGEIPLMLYHGGQLDQDRIGKPVKHKIELKSRDGRTWTVSDRPVGVVRRFGLDGGHYRFTADVLDTQEGIGCMDWMECMKAGGRPVAVSACCETQGGPMPPVNINGRALTLSPPRQVLEISLSIRGANPGAVVRRLTTFANPREAIHG